jgi:hypothetical protein
MARNDVVLLDSLIDKSKSQLGHNKDESELFELFVFDQILKDYDLSFEELESGWTDGANDGGLDGFFVFVDGRVATPDSLHYSRKKSPEVDVHIFTAKRSPSFEQQPLDTLIGSLSELLSLGTKEARLKYPFNEAVLEQRKLFSTVYISLADRQPKLQIRIHYCSRGETSRVAPNIKSRATALHSVLNDLFSNANIDVSFVGATELLESARKQRDFTLRLPYVENYISREGENYILLCTLTAYYRFITDEQGKLRRYLFESNVRDYLGEVLINRDIGATLARFESPQVSDFWWLNNGITILGTTASVAGKELCIENVQIVNGLQTTETIYRFFSAKQQPDDNRAILVKVILAADDEIRARIIKATNYQNTVDLASLRGLDKIQRDIEEFLFDHGWFYDRRKNHHKNEGRPAERIVSVPYLASAVRAIALRDPARSQKQRSRQLRDDKVYRQVFNPRWDLRVYLASLEITRAIESTLQTRRRLFDSPPIALVHYIGYVYTCHQLKKATYRPEEVSALVGSPPTEDEINTIRDELKNASSGYHAPGRSYRGIKLNRAFIQNFINHKLSQDTY